MEAFKNENVTLMDFPLICRICLKRSDLKLFKEADYLLDLFLTLTNIDVRSTASLPKCLCNDCIKTLEDISVFIDNSKYNVAEWGKNFMYKSENEHVDTGECESSQKHVGVKNIEEYTEDSQYFNGLKICRICHSTDFLRPAEEKAHLLQLFQNITDIDVKAEVIFSSRNICDKCINKLEAISSFISVSLSNEMKLKNAIGKSEALETDCLEENAFDSGYRYGAKKEDGDFDKNTNCNEIKSLHTIINVKEEIDDIPESCMEQIPESKINIFNEEPSFDCSNKDEFRTEKHLLKPLDVEWHRKSSTQNWLLQQNMLIHTGEKPFKCDCCEKKFTHESDLQQHKLIHSGEKPFKCNCCGKTFNHRGNFRQHMLIHSGKKPFKCDCCGKTFNQKGNLQQHMLIHSGEKPFKCDCCKKSFNDRSNLQQHMFIHSGEKPYNCDRCEKKFTNKSHFQQHKLIHSGEKPFKCDCCEKTFNHKGNLQQHMLVHSGKKPFKCDCCGKTFNQNGNLQQHMLIHSAEKLFKCDCCEKKFTHMHSLKRHLRLVHVNARSDKTRTVEI